MSSPAGVYGSGYFIRDADGFGAIGSLVDDGTFVLHCALPFELDLPPSQWGIIEPTTWDGLTKDRGGPPKRRRYWVRSP